MPGGFHIGWDICNGTDQGTATATSTGTAVASSTTGGTYGSYVQLVASSAIDASYISINISGGPFSSSNQIVVKIAIGAGGSEVDIIKDLMMLNGGGSGVSTVYSFPVVIPAGTRIAVAAAPTANAADTAQVQVTLFQGSFTQIEGCAGVDSIGQTNALGTAIVPGAANVKGSYAQLTASTSKDYLGFSFTLDYRNVGAFVATAQLLDIAIGASGSEVIIIPNYLFRNGQTNVQEPGLNSPVYPIAIPAGTRIAARVQNTGGTGTSGLTLYGVYQ